MSSLSDTTFVYISYSHYDKQVVRALKEYLKKEGISVFDDEAVPLGVEWQSYFNQQLLKATVFIPVISDNYVNSKYTERERELANFNQDINKGMLILPYIIGNSEHVPYEFMGRLYLKATGNQQNDFERIKCAIIEHENRRQIQEIEEKNTKLKIQTSLNDYLKNVFDRLENNRKYYRNLGIGAYLASVMFLLIAVGVSVYMTKQKITRIDVAIFVFGSGMIMTCVLAALSRMMFIIGRSFMVESIRNADRYHAISFGKFYIDAFGDNISKREIKEVLGAWNFDSETDFTKQDAKEIDPNITAFLEKVNISKS